jgi:hypothetical protein
MRSGAGAFLSASQYSADQVGSAQRVASSEGKIAETDFRSHRRTSESKFGSKVSEKIDDNRDYWAGKTARP